MAPYAVAHMKLGLQLQELGYDFASDERLHVYRTNTLEEPHIMSGAPLFTAWLAAEASAANHVKQNAPVMVVLGNPPYSGHSSNKGEWISKLLRGQRVHDFERMIERGIHPQDIRQVVLTGDAIEYDPAGYRGTDAGVLFNGRDATRPLHVKVVERTLPKMGYRHFVVTAYEPDLTLWEADFARRKEP